MVKAVVFDYDGTLMDSVRQICLIGNLTLAEFSFGGVSIEKYKKFIGDGARKLIERLIAETVQPNEELIDKVLNRYILRYDKMENQGLFVYGEVFEMLSKLNQRQIKIAIISNKPERHLKAGIATEFVGVKIDCVVGGDSGFPLKPDPTSLIDVIKKLGVKKSEVLYVGDGDADVVVAKNAGVNVLSALWGYRTREELEKVGGVNFIKSPLELFDHIK